MWPFEGLHLPLLTSRTYFSLSHLGGKISVLLYVAENMGFASYYVDYAIAPSGLYVIKGKYL